MHKKEEQQPAQHNKHSAHYHSKMMKVLDEPSHRSLPYRLFDEEKDRGKPFRNIPYGAYRQKNHRAKKAQLARERDLTVSPDVSVMNDSNSDKSPKLSSYAATTLRLAGLTVDIGDKFHNPTIETKETTCARSDTKSLNDQALIDFLSAEITKLETQEKHRSAENLCSLTESLLSMTKSS